jgi:hypothetical protein
MKRGCSKTKIATAPELCPKARRKVKKVRHCGKTEGKRQQPGSETRLHVEKYSVLADVKP